MKPSEWVRQNMGEGAEFYSGGEVLVFCPYHDNTESPALMVNTVKCVFLCMSCGERGTLQKLSEKIGKPFLRTMDVHDVESSLRRLRGKMERQEEDELEPIGKKSEAWLNQFVKRRHPYWRERGITDAVRREWQLGYDRQRNAVTIPICAMNGSVMGVIRRHLGDEHRDRWRYPSGFRMQLHLFAAHRLKVYGNDGLTIVEGSIDCIRVWMAGVPCVATLGAQFSEHQRNLIHKVAGRRIHVMMDNDEAGREAQSDIESKLSADGYEVFRVPYPTRVPEGAKHPKDPGDMTLGQIKTALSRSESIRRLRLKSVSRKL